MTFICGNTCIKTSPCPSGLIHACRCYRCWFSFHCSCLPECLYVHWKRAGETWARLIIHGNSETPSPPPISCSKTCGLTLLCNFLNTRERVCSLSPARHNDGPVMSLAQSLNDCSGAAKWSFSMMLLMELRKKTSNEKVIRNNQTLFVKLMSDYLSKMSVFPTKRGR